MKRIITVVAVAFVAAAVAAGCGGTSSSPGPVADGAPAAVAPESPAAVAEPESSSSGLVERGMARCVADGYTRAECECVFGGMLAAFGEERLDEWIRAEERGEDGGGSLPAGELGKVFAIMGACGIELEVEPS